jgi:hypothetical protein
MAQDAPQSVVIVRAFGDQPLKRIVVGAVEDRVLIANPASLERIEAGQTEPVALPRSDVFQYDDVAYEALETEWQMMGLTDAAAWLKLRKWGG